MVDKKQHFGTGNVFLLFSQEVIINNSAQNFFFAMMAGNYRTCNLSQLTSQSLLTEAQTII